jgi:hypothetical protein
MLRTKTTNNWQPTIGASRITIRMYKESYTPLRNVWILLVQREDDRRRNQPRRTVVPGDGHAQSSRGGEHPWGSDVTRTAVGDQDRRPKVWWMWSNMHQYNMQHVISDHRTHLRCDVSLWMALITHSGNAGISMLWSYWFGMYGAQSRALEICPGVDL